MTRPRTPPPFCTFELHAATEPVTNRRGKVTAPRHPAYARCLIGFHGVTQTTDPAQLRWIAAELNDLADALTTAQRGPAPAHQPTLDLGAA